MGGNYSALLVTRKVSAVLLYSSLGHTLVEKTVTNWKKVQRRSKKHDGSLWKPKFLGKKWRKEVSI